MSEKVQVDIQDDDNQDQPEDKTTEDDTAAPSDVESDAGEKSLDDDPETKLKAAEQKAEEYYDRLLRASAEFDNYKKRTTREMQELVRYANEKIFKELLSVVDNLDRAIESAQQDGADDDPLLEGVRLILNEVDKIFERHNVKPIKAIGEPFDPNFHQAMMQEETEDEPANTVVKEMQKGYVMHDRLLRPSMVVVSKSKTEES
jgi:molecular chaperone GrpE